jgi:hypothetical protein
MYTTAYQKKKSPEPESAGNLSFTRNCLARIMLAFLLMTAIQLSAKTTAQTITLSEKSARLETVLKKVKKQTGFAFLYQDQLLLKSVPVSIELVNTSLEDALKLIFETQPLTYEIIAKKLISIKAKVQLSSTKTPLPAIAAVEITGTVRGESGEPLAGATVTVQGSSTSVVTNDQGRFSISVPDNNATLVFSFVGYQSISRTVASLGADPTIVLIPQQDVIQDVVVVVMVHNEGQKLQQQSVRCL